MMISENEGHGQAHIGEACPKRQGHHRNAGKAAVSGSMFNPPVWIKKHQAIASYQIETAAASLAAQKEDKLTVIGITELLDQLLALADAGGTIKPQERILQEPVRSSVILCDEHRTHAVNMTMAVRQIRHLKAGCLIS